MGKKWDVFISHSSEDKDTIVRELAKMLDSLGVRVWYDEFSLDVGDSLSQKIDQGLIDSNFGIIIISKAFLNKKWPDYEYRSLLSKEDNFKKVILPIWHNITYKEVKSFSLYLADKFALDTQKNSVQEIVKKLVKVIRPDVYNDINRLILYKKLINEGKIDMVKNEDLKWGDKQRDTLSMNQINRIKNTFYGVGQNFNTPLDETLDCYLYDHNPDREIQVWEIINATYLEFILGNNIQDKHKQKDVARQVVMMSLGQISKETVLTAKELTALYEIWKQNFHLS
ncbi:MAG: toll/interleukin-1 receptor domain-containing protein [Sphingobacteriales bacterium]|nr:MAG: toll/interleukin-1 receptor domain-containing protein [Sphingobacteriales bacterium]